MIKYLEDMLECYNKIFFCDTKDKDVQLNNDIISYVRNSGENIGFICGESLKNTYSDEFSTQLKKLYFMYEFSDRVKMLSKQNQFGELINFVDTGILTKDEAIEILLH